MSSASPLGFSPRQSVSQPGVVAEHVVLQRPLQRVLAFTRLSIDDVVNNPIAKNEVLGYYKLQNWIHRRCEVLELEQQWNGK